MATANHWYIINNTGELDTPALVVYPDRVKSNIGMVKTMIDDASRLRPHVKTHKSKEVCLLMLQAGITKFKCATIAEAEMLGMSQAPDVLLAYQPTGPKLKRLIALIRKYPASVFSCLIDNEATAKNISGQAVLNGIVIPVYIDLNIGMNRTGIIADEHAFNLYKSCDELPGIKIKGLHAYDGHIHDSNFSVRQNRFTESIAPVLKLADKITQSGYTAPVIIAGGSPTFPVVAAQKKLECSPGTFAYWDRGYQLAYPEQAFLPAALVIARVISLPDETKICIDVGHKSVASENELAKRIYFLNAPQLVFTSHSEEHLVADAGKGHAYKVGDILYGLPYHICPTVALYERAIIIENNAVAGEWPIIARNRKITV